jgi:oligopeptide/dipeptide ABC transporter ATP-binding protein
MNEDRRNFLELEEVKKYFPATKRLFGKSHLWIKAVDGVSFNLKKGETLSLVGESGSGKTTCAKLVLGLEIPTSGAVLYEGVEVHRLKHSQLKRYHSSVQAVFQDPWSSLDPRSTLMTIIAEPLRALNIFRTSKETKDRVMELLKIVGLKEYQASSYPHQLSGGQRQRVAIARALAPFPTLIVLDEPVSSLDVSIRAQILNLLKRLQEELNLSYIMIAHDLATILYMSDRVAVMYLGQIVEQSGSEELFANPMHPYTRALMSAALPSHPDEKRNELVLQGEISSPLYMPTGCRFHPRCPNVMAQCSQTEPYMKEMFPGHFVQCYLY